MVNSNPNSNPFSLDRHFLRFPPLPRRTGHFQQRYFDSSLQQNYPTSSFVHYGRNGEELDINDPEYKSMFNFNPLFYCSIGR